MHEMATKSNAEFAAEEHDLVQRSEKSQRSQNVCVFRSGSVKINNSIPKKCLPENATLNTHYGAITNTAYYNQFDYK